AVSSADSIRGSYTPAELSWSTTSPTAFLYTLNAPRYALKCAGVGWYIVASVCGEKGTSSVPKNPILYPPTRHAMDGGVIASGSCSSAPVTATQRACSAGPTLRGVMNCGFAGTVSIAGSSAIGQPLVVNPRACSNTSASLPMPIGGRP